MDYLKHYNLLIERSKPRKLKSYTERHHIIPKCMGGLDNDDNLVELTPEEHYLAHQLLAKIYPENKQLLFAACMMCAKRPSNKLYGWIRRGISEHMKNNNPNVNGKVNRARKGKYKISEEAKRNISIGLKAHNVNVGIKNGMSNISPWMHPRATTKSKLMWGKADEYYEWWINSKLKHGQNAMARAFKEEYTMTHANLVKRFRNGWNPSEDDDWLKSCKI